MCVERHACCNSDIAVPYSSNCSRSSMSDCICRSGTLRNIFYYLGTESVEKERIGKDLGTVHYLYLRGGTEEKLGG